MGIDVHARERTFHDDWAAAIDPRDVKVIETFNASTSPEQRWLARRLGNIAGKHVLELGSGAGEGGVFFALRGASVTATDLSPRMLEVVARVAAHHGVGIERRVCSAEDLSIFADASFDVVYAASLLHHVDIVRCLDEVWRVLRPGGIAAFCDPLAHNPVINVYRRMATKVRTTDEHPLRRQDIRLFAARFRNVETEFFWLSTLLVFLRFYFIDRVHPNADRYWERLISKEPELRRIYLPLEKCDRILLKLFPFLKWWCWYVAVLVTK